MSIFCNILFTIDLLGEILENPTIDRMNRKGQSQSTNPLLKQLKATKNNRVYVFDYYGLVNPGSVGSIERATKQLREIYQ